jgi:hypothetical protein
MNQSPDTPFHFPPDVIVVPTYNEKDNLPLLVPQVRRTVPQAHLLIVDDNSPDGTGQMADAMATRTRTFTCCTARQRMAWAALTLRVRLGAPARLQPDRADGR